MPAAQAGCKALIASAVLGFASVPMALWSNYRAANGMHFPVIDRKNREPFPTVPDDGSRSATPVGGDSSEPMGSEFPTLKNIASQIVKYGQEMYASFPALPSLLPGAAADREVESDPFWAPGYQQKKMNPVPAILTTTTTKSQTKLNSTSAIPFINTIRTVTTFFDKDRAWAPIKKETILNGINAYQRWGPNIPQDARLNGIRTERPCDPALNIDQLLDTFAPIMPRKMGHGAVVDQYEYSVLKYAIHNQLRPGDNNFTHSDPARLQVALSQKALQSDVAHIFFNSLGSTFATLDAQPLEKLIRKSTDTFLRTNPPLNTIGSFATNLKVDANRRLNFPGHAFTTEAHTRLTTLLIWLVESELSAIDPLFNTQINVNGADFEHLQYKSDDAVLMRIGAGFIAKFSSNYSTPLTTVLLKEAGLHSLIDLPLEEWPSSTYDSLLQFSSGLPQNLSGKPRATTDERIKEALAALIAPEMPKIHLMKLVKIKEDLFTKAVNDQVSNALHQRQSQDALKNLIRAKFDLYSYGLAHLPLSDRENLIFESNRNLVRIYTPRVTLYEASHAGVAYQASFNGTSGLILGAGPTESDGSTDYYLFSEERSWGSPVVSKITEQIRRTGSVNKYVSENHLAFTSGIRFPSTNHTAFDTTAFSISATTLDEIAFSVSDALSYPPEIHNGLSVVSPSQPLTPGLAEKIFHSKIFAIGKFVIGIFPGGNCVIAVLDVAEMIALPAKTDAELIDQGITLAVDSLFCFTGLIKLGETRNIIRSARTAFNFRTPEEFGAVKVAKQKLEPPSDIEEPVLVDGLKLTEGRERGLSRQNLRFRTGISELVDIAPLKAPTFPSIISIHDNTLNVPYALRPEGLIQKSDGGPIFVVMDVGEPGKRVSYLWNESDRQLEQQTDQWLSAYGHLMDRDPKVLALFVQDLTRRFYSKHISDMLYHNKCVTALNQRQYQSHFDHPPEGEVNGVYRVGDRRYIKLVDQFYLLSEKQGSPTVERIVGQGIPEDLQLDVQYDSATWHVKNNHLIKPLHQLPDGVTSFDGALKKGFNLPEGWQSTAMYIDSQNGDQFIFSFLDRDGNTLYRRGPDRKNAFEMLSREEFDENRCGRVRRSPQPGGAGSGCSSMGPHIIPLSPESARANAISQLVALDVETRPYYERPLLRLEIVRDVETINSHFHENSELRQRAFVLLSRMESKPTLVLPRAIQEMGTLMQGRVAVPAETIKNLTNFWESIQRQIAKESADGLRVNDPALQKICQVGLQLCMKLRSYNNLGDTYTSKVRKLNQLNYDYESRFLIPQQRASSRLWKTIFGPVLTSQFATAQGWTFETHAKGISQIREKYGVEVAHDISYAYADSHELAGDLVDWSRADPAAFWRQISSFFHVSGALSLPAQNLLVRTLSKFEQCAHPQKMDALRVISPAVSPDGIQYRYSLQEHAEGIPQEASLFGNVVSAYTYEGGKNQGKIYLTTTTFLSPTSNAAELQETLQHELSHLAIPKSADELYLNTDRSKYGHYSAGALGRQADVLLDSQEAFLKYIEDNPAQKSGFLLHCKVHLPGTLRTYFPEGVEGTSIDKSRFRAFVIALFKGPPDIKIKAFLMPDIFVAWFQHMAKGLPKFSSPLSANTERRQKREASTIAVEAEIERLLVRDVFETIRREEV